MKATHKSLTTQKYMTPDKLVISQEATSHARIAQQPRQQQQCIRLDLEPEEAADQTSEPKLPDNASRRDGRITCGRRLYRRAEDKDSSAVMPSKPKLPDSEHAKIACGKRLYRRTKHKDSTALPPIHQQGHAAQKSQQSCQAA